MVAVALPLTAAVLAVCAALVGVLHPEGRRVGAVQAGVVMALGMVDHATGAVLAPLAWFVVLIASAVVAAAARGDAAMRIHRGAAALVMAVVMVAGHPGATTAVAAGALHGPHGPGLAPLLAGLLAGSAAASAAAVIRTVRGQGGRTHRAAGVVEASCMALSTFVMVLVPTIGVS